MQSKDVQRILGEPRTLSGYQCKLNILGAANNHAKGSGKTVPNKATSINEANAQI